MNDAQLKRLTALLVSVSERSVPLTQQTAETLLRQVITEPGSPFGPCGVPVDAPIDWTDDAACLSGLAERLEEESAAESDRGNDSTACAWTCRAYELRQIVLRMVRASGAPGTYKDVTEGGK